MTDIKNETESLYRLGVLRSPRAIKEYIQEVREAFRRAREKNGWRRING